MVALILSTTALSLRAIFFIPPSIIARWAITEVNLSSWRTTCFVGYCLRRRSTKGSMAAHDWLGLPFICVGLPTTIISTSFWAKYCASHDSRVAVGTVSSPPAMMRNGSLTATPVRFKP